jgi:hypothetical protein
MFQSICQFGRPLRAPRLVTSAALSLLMLMGGCASMNAVRSDVSTYSQWPAGRAASTYRFERLPSQQAQAAEQSQLEALAKPSIEAAGFKPAADAASAELSIQLAPHAPIWWCVTILFGGAAATTPTTPTTPAALGPGFIPILTRTTPTATVMDTAMALACNLPLHVSYAKPWSWCLTEPPIKPCMKRMP